MLLTYFILMLDNVRDLSGISAFAAGIVLTFLLAGLITNDLKELIPYIKASIVTLVIAVLVLTFTPTTKQAALIFLSGQEDVVATAKNLPKLTKLGTDYLIELLEEGKKDDDNN